MVLPPAMSRQPPGTRPMAVVHGVLGRGDGQVPGAHDAAGGRQQRLDDRFREIGLAPPGLLPGEQLQPRHAVDAAPVPQFVQGRQLIVGEGQDERAVALEGHGELFADLVVHGVAGHVEPGFQGTRLGVEAGVDDGAVGLGGGVGDIALLLDQERLELVAAQLAPDEAPDDPASDDGYV